MKLGIAYNMFDGYELLSYVTDNASKYTDFCCIIIQEISNTGHTTDLSKMYEAIQKCGNKIHKVIKYTPNLKLSPMQNEIEKRNIGLKCCQDNGCTHGLTSDVDELFDPEQANKAKYKIESEGYDSSACMMLEYYKDTHHIFKPNDTFYVSFIHKLDDRKFVLAMPWPITVDPTKRMLYKKLCIFKRDELQQHHLSWIRNSIYDKFINSSNRQNKSEQSIKLSDEYYKNWKDPMPALLPDNNGTFKTELLKVDYKFLPEIKL